MVPSLLQVRDVPYGCDDLANTTMLAILNVLLLVLLITSTFLKILRRVQQHSTQGLAFGYLFLAVPFCISQLCIAITGSMVLFPGIECLPAVTALGLSAFNPALLLLSSLVILTGSLTLFVLALKFGPHNRSRSCERDSHEDPLPPSPRATIETYVQRVYSAAIALYILIFFFPTILSLLVTTLSTKPDLIFYFYLRFTRDFHFSVLPILNIAQFVPQVVLLWRERRNLPNLPLDIRAYVLDVITFVLVGLSWREYMLQTYPSIVNLWYGVTHPGTWQYWGSCIWFDYVILGLGQGVVLVFYLFLRRRYSRKLRPVIKKEDDEEHQSREQATETTPLL